MTEYAIIKTGSKQYRVKAGDVIDVELLDSKEDGKIEFSDVLFFHNGKEAKVGAPFVKNSLVRGEVIADQVGGPKVIAYKYKQRKRSYRKVGHRQHYTRVRITELV